MLNEEFSDTIKLMLEWYPKSDGYLVGKEEIKNPASINLEEIFAIYIEEGELLSFANGSSPVTKDIAVNLQPFIEHPIDLGKYDYFVTARRVG